MARICDSALLCLLAAILLLCGVSITQAQTGDVFDQLTWGEWTDGLLVEQQVTTDVTPGIIHLDRVLSTFENGWSTVNTDYYFQIMNITAVDGDDQSDDVYGSFYDVDDNGVAFPDPITAPHRVNNSQGLIQWNPVTLDHEQNLRVHFTLFSETTNATKLCTLLIQRYAPGCTLSQLKDSHGNTVFAPPVPTCLIHYDRTAQRFTLNVTGAYLNDQATYLIDFDDFNGGNANYGGNSLRTPHGTCGSLDTIPSAATVPFIEMWYSAPTATFPHAIDGAYPTYRTRSTWAISNVDSDCDQVHFNTSYSFTELTDCKTHSNGDAVTQSTNNGMLMYTGNLYVNVLVPIDLNHEEWGYTKFRNVYPFEFGFKQRMTRLVGVPTEEDLRVFVRIAELNAGGVLNLWIETQYARPDGLQSATVSPSGHMTVTAPADPCSGSQVLCIQLWGYTGVAAWVPASDDGSYTFEWQAINDSHPVSVTVDLEEKLQEVQSETGLDIGSLQLRVFANAADLQLGQNPIDNTYNFAPRDTVYVRADLMVPTADEQNFDLVVENAYLCYSAIEGYQIEYSETGKQGCLDPFILDTERFQLINNTQAITHPWDIDFGTDLMGGVSSYLNPTGPSDVFSFIANPQQSVDRIYTIHLECSISQRNPNGKRSADGADITDSLAPRIRYVSTMATNEYARDVEFTTQSHDVRSVRGSSAPPPSSSASFGIQRTQSVPSDSSSTSWNLIIGAGACVVLAAIGAAAFLVWKRRQAARVVVYSPVTSSDAIDLEGP